MKPAKAMGIATPEGICEENNPSHTTLAADPVNMPRPTITPTSLTLIVKAPLMTASLGGFATVIDQF